jgi:cytochrome oxidase Cu insertion factor (SCO1/SenC/PrrC family)
MLRAIRWIVGAGFVTAGMVLAGATTQAQDPKPGVGDPFPNIPVPATQIDLVKKGGKELSIQDLKGKIVVVAFYPKALTGG